SRRGRRWALFSWLLALRLFGCGLLRDFVGASEFLECRNRLAIVPREAEQVPHRGRPSADVAAVGVEHGDGETVHSEGHAGGMGRLTRGIRDAPGGSEMNRAVTWGTARGR